jgi:hypothetical protein
MQLYQHTRGVGKRGGCGVEGEAREVADVSAVVPIRTHSLGLTHLFSHASCVVVRCVGPAFFFLVLFPAVVNGAQHVCGIALGRVSLSTHTETSPLS